MKLYLIIQLSAPGQCIKRDSEYTCHYKNIPGKISWRIASSCKGTNLELFISRFSFSKLIIKDSWG